MLYISVFFSILLYCDAYKLLVVFPTPSKSHAILGEGYVRHLLEAGHEVSYITPVPIKNATSNLRQIDVSENFKLLSPEIFDVTKLLRKELNLQDHQMWTNVMHQISDDTYNYDIVQDILKNPSEKFDAVIVEWLFSELGAGFAAVFDCPLIWSSSMVPHTHVLSLIDDHLNTAYTVDCLATDYSVGFVDRAHRLWQHFYTWYFKRQFLETEVRSYQKIFGPAAAIRGRTLPTFDEVRYNASIMLGNSHITIGEAIVLPQNYKDIGGYHVKNPPQPLPQSFQTIMDNSKNGVIYFSLGSMLQPSKMSSDLKREFLNMFSKLKQTVIWKLGEELPDVPKNVHIVSWAPQQSILAHPNCVLFITHSGLLSTIETVYYGVPIIGLPFFADQHININRAVLKGFGKRLEFSDNIPEELKVAIDDMVSNPRYRQRAKEISSIYHDRMISPGKELVFWVEHVIRTGGARHLRSVAMDVEWYKKAHLDLAVAVLAIAAVVIYGLVNLITKHTLVFKKKVA